MKPFLIHPTLFNITTFVYIVLMSFSCNPNNHEKEIQSKQPLTKKEENNTQPHPKYYINGTYIENGSTKLAASIYRPRIAPLCPAVLLICDEGQHNQGELKYWADMFANNGIAALVYDKRNVSDFPQLQIREHLSDIGNIDDLATDAEMAYQLLKDYPGIASDKVGIIGFGQGANIAAMIATKNPSIPFIVSASGHATSNKEFYINQELKTLRESVYFTDRINEAREIWNELFAYAKTKKDGEALQKKLDKTYQENWGKLCFPRYIPTNDEIKYLMIWNSAAFKPTQYWSKIQVPSFVIFDEEDQFVQIVKSTEMFQKSFGNRPGLLTIQIFERPFFKSNVINNEQPYTNDSMEERYRYEVLQWVIKILDGEVISTQKDWGQHY